MRAEGLSVEDPNAHCERKTVSFSPVRSERRITSHKKPKRQVPLSEILPAPERGQT